MSEKIIVAREVMQKDVLTIDGMTSVKEAVEKMRSLNVTGFLVSKRNENDAWGIVTVMDIIKHVVVPSRKSENVFVYEIMTKPVISVPANMDIRYVIRLLQRIGVRRAPVEALGEIVGMVTLSQLIMDNDLL